MLYKIVVGGYISEAWFEGLSADRQPNLTTRLQGQIVDQAALYGVLRRINDLGLELIAVYQVFEEANR